MKPGPRAEVLRVGVGFFGRTGVASPFPPAREFGGSAVSSSSKKKCGFGALEASKMKLSEYFTIRWPFSVYGIVLKFSAFHGILESTDSTPSLNDGP